MRSSYFFIGRVLLALIVMGVSSCKNEPKNEIKTTTIGFTKEGQLQLFDSTTTSEKVVMDIEIADSDYETQTGLMYRDAMGEHQGMLFIFPNVAVHSFYMKNTKIPLDILFIDNQQKVVTISENTTPYDEAGISSEVPIQYVLEINAGLTKKWQLQVGDSIAFTKD